VFDLNRWFTFAHSSCVFVPLCPNDFALREQKDPKREETIMWASWRRLQLKKELENSPDATATILGF
jgi:hypothetical protein